MALFFKTKAAPKPDIGAETPSRKGSEGFFRLSGCGSACENELYSKLRAEVPIIDACIGKMIRLVGGFRAKALDPRFQPALDRFVKNVRVGASGRGLQTFADTSLDSLLTYGCSLGEIVYDRTKTSIAGIYPAPVKNMEIREGDGPLSRQYYCCRGALKPIKLSHPENLVFTALSPTPESPCGVSILRGLPGLSAILLRIYECIGQNFDRVGNVRYAVTYKPSGDNGDRAFARERAAQIAKEWSSGMAAMKNGDIRDFVAVGDVGIKVIGADNQMIDTEIPVRQLLEQLIAKLGIPPFLLGLSWSTSERMSAQQTDILTSELEYYRRLLEPSLIRICDAFLKISGSADGLEIEWDNIDLQDETELALARLRNAQARAVEISNEKEELKSV